MPDPEAYGRLDALLVAVLDLPPGERKAFLDSACGADPALRQQVESLIEGSEQHSPLDKFAFAGLKGSAVGTDSTTPMDPIDLLRKSPPQSVENRESSTSRSSDGTFRPGKLLAGRFQVVRFIARGGMGEVYEAIDLEFKEPVALKTLPLNRTDDERALERFRREIQLARKVTHPNVCRIFDVFRHRDTDPEGQPREEITFLSMELLGGVTLSDHIRRNGRIDPREAVPLAAQMAAGLDAAHQAGVVHRDFKSGNVMLLPPSSTTQPPRVVITDFSLARAMQPSSTITETGAFLGTPAYMAPEQVTGGDVTPAADIYAFGVVLYEMITATHPFSAETAIGTAFKRLTEAPPSPRDRVPDLDVSWEQTILRCLSREPGQRFARATEIADALGRETPRATASGSAEAVPAETIRVGSAAINPDLGPLRERLFLAHSANELTRLKYELEQYLATRPTDVEGRILRDDVDRALNFDLAVQAPAHLAMPRAGRPEAGRVNAAPFLTSRLRYAVGGMVGVLAITVVVRVGWNQMRPRPEDLRPPVAGLAPTEAPAEVPRGVLPPAAPPPGVLAPPDARPSSTPGATVSSKERDLLLPPPAATITPESAPSPAPPPEPARPVTPSGGATAASPPAITLPSPAPVPDSTPPPTAASPSPGPLPIAPPTKDPAEQAETTAKRLIQALLEEYCSSREAMSAERSQKINPTVTLDTLLNQFRQFKSIRCMLQGMPEYVKLDYNVGKATVKIGVKQIVDRKVGGVAANETIMTAEVSRSGIGADHWVIDTVRHDPKPK